MNVKAATVDLVRFLNFVSKRKSIYILLKKHKSRNLNYFMFMGYGFILLCCLKYGV